jgi:hypothetical protein
MGPVRKIPPAWLDNAMPQKRIAFVIVHMRLSRTGLGHQGSPGSARTHSRLRDAVSRACCWAHWCAWAHRRSREWPERTYAACRRVCDLVYQVKSERSADSSKL